MDTRYTDCCIQIQTVPRYVRRQRFDQYSTECASLFHLEPRNLRLGIPRCHPDGNCQWNHQLGTVCRHDGTVRARIVHFGNWRVPSFSTSGIDYRDGRSVCGGTCRVQEFRLWPDGCEVSNGGMFMLRMRVYSRMQTMLTLSRSLKRC